ncbi:hypothetical protein SSP35_35_00160 [Streptomyces sp. NBRC 110611]|nr:hypothetical protein SSP35_35_00160 [Streptomyces sp. NBRC 110611]
MDPLAVRHRPAAARLIARRTRGLLFLTGRTAPSGTATLDVCPETRHARLPYRRAEEIFEENTGLLANPLTSRTSRTWTAGSCTDSATLSLLSFRVAIDSN